MAKGSDKLRGGFDIEDTGGALSGLLADEDEFDRRALWRLGSWAAASVGAVIVALVVNQSSIGIRREQTASADFIKQAQQLQLSAREGQNETKRLMSSIDTLNNDRDRLYSRVAVLEQGLDSVTGTIARQTSAPPSPQASASAATLIGPPPLPSSAPSPPPVASAPAATPAATASADPPPATARPSPAAPVVAPVTATAPVVTDKQASTPPATPAQEPRSAPEPRLVVASAVPQQPAPADSAGSLMASKSMMAPPDPAAGKLLEPIAPPKVAVTPAVTVAPLPEVVAAVAPKADEEPEHASPAPVAQPTVQRTEFGVDVGGANSIPGLRALWRGLLKSRSNAALAALHPIIVIKENNNGLGMQLRLVAGPINDAAAAAKICASLAVNDRSCTTAVFEGQRLVLNADEPPKIDDNKADADKAGASTGKPSGHRRYSIRHARDEAPPSTPKPEPSSPSTLSLIFGRR
jgi:hypothetical protein